MELISSLDKGNKLSRIMTPQKYFASSHQVCKIDYCNKFLTEITNLCDASEEDEQLGSHKPVPRERATKQRVMTKADLGDVTDRETYCLID
jgi:hypothetical protein